MCERMEAPPADPLGGAGGTHPPEREVRYKAYVRREGYGKTAEQESERIPR